MCVYTKKRKKKLSLWSDHGYAIVGVIRRAGAVRFDHRDLRCVLGAVQRVPATQTLAVVLGKDEQHEGVDAAVGITEANADVVRVDKGDGRGVVAQVDHLDDVVGGPADQKHCDDHEDHLGCPLRPHGLLPLDSPDGAEDVVEGEGVEGADDEERDDEAEDRLVERVPVHVLGPL